MLLTKEVEVKVCSKCKREFPRTSVYFNNDKYNPDGLTSSCRECRSGKRIFDIVIKEGYKNCVKCKRELKIDIKYFPADKACKDGFKNVCRECGADGHFMKDGYTGKHIWTQEEVELLIKIYPHSINKDIILEYFHNETLKGLQNKASKLGLKKTDEILRLQKIITGLRMSGENSPWYGKQMSEETKLKLSLSKKGKYIGVNNKLYGAKWDMDDQRRFILSQNRKGLWSGKNNPRHQSPLVGEQNGNWRGGVNNLYHELRSEIKQWKLDSMEKCNYKCVVTNGEFDVVHHLYPFSDILDEVFETLQLDKRKQVMDYTSSEFERIRGMTIKLHEKYGLGVCLSKNIHKLFHDQYGYTNNNLEQFEEFKQNYNNGLYKDLIEEAS